MAWWPAAATTTSLPGSAISPTFLPQTELARQRPWRSSTDPQRSSSASPDLGCYGEGVAAAFPVRAVLVGTPLLRVTLLLPTSPTSPTPPSNHETLPPLLFPPSPPRGSSPHRRTTASDGAGHGQEMGKAEEEERRRRATLWLGEEATAAAAGWKKGCAARGRDPGGRHGRRKAS